MYSVFLSIIVNCMMYVYWKVMICGDNVEGFCKKKNSEGDECWMIYSDL